MKAKKQEQVDVYRSRMNKVLDYIETHIEKNFTLEELASEALFSKFHFNRIFWAMIGETPFQFINRIKIERAATLLILYPNETISDIAYRSGFSSLSLFSRNFKNYFDCSASQWRENKNPQSEELLRLNSNSSKIKSNIEKNEDDSSMYFCRETNSLKWRTNMELNKGVEVKTLPNMTVAYIRHIGPYKGDEALFERLFNKMFKWAAPRGLINTDTKSIVIYHDDPSVTDEQKLRMSVCVTVPDNTKTNGEIGKMELPGGEYAIARFELKADQYEKAWQWLYGTWLPSSGYQPDDKPCFEMYTEEPRDDGVMPVDICIPVKPV